FTSANNLIASFLSGYFDCDGTVEFSRRAVSITSVSNSMLKDVQLLLLRFNCASIRQRDTLYITGNSLKRFNESIGFSLLEKIQKAKIIEAKSSGSYALDTVPISKEAFVEMKGSLSMGAIASNYYEYAGGKTKPVLKSINKIANKLNNDFLTQICEEELAFIEVVEITEGTAEEVYDFTVQDNHNFVAEGMFIHNTTFTDSLVARAGLISKELAGQQRMMDFDEQEQKRGITIKAANISLGFQYQGSDYLINLIDTPGHVDFGGHVTRAMRAVDGVILVVDAVEGVMPQTETVLRQALKEKSKPVLFINKIDRLINELKLKPEEMQARLIKIIGSVNKLVTNFAPAEFKDPWFIQVDKGNVAFGSAFNKWAVSFSSMQKNKITFKDIYELCVKGDHKSLVEKSPLDDVVLEMAINHLPPPLVAQKYRIPTLWHGDPNSEEYKYMTAVDSKAKVCGIIFGVVIDEHAGEVGVCRLFSGTAKKGVEVNLASKYTKEKIQQVGVYMGPDRVLVDEVPAGNIAAIIGLHDLYVGETISETEMEPFEQIKHYSEPVVTKSIEAKNTKDLVKLIEVLRQIAKEDPTIKIEINHETGEHLMSGMGELHLEIVEYKISKEKGVDIETSKPIVVYREAIRAKVGPIEGKSPNRHSKFQVIVEPLEEGVLKAMDEGLIPDGRPKGKQLVETLVKAGLPRDEAKNLKDVLNKCLFLDMTRGVQYMDEVMELLIEGFEEAVNAGPLAKEKTIGVKIKVVDATIHEDPVHRGPAQTIPAIRRPILAGMLLAGITLLEPKQKIFIQIPQDYMSNVINLVQGRRGQVLDIQQEGEVVNLTSKVPVAETFGFANDIRGATQGRAVWYHEYAGYDRLPQDLQTKVVAQIRERKGESREPPSPQEFLD
ncbi:elongation factor EF-2, partial [Candidatus Micrarchaeota archaeon]|nr:elongation factor EF-2 [Candidatus Micrarchaeota archaeon]